MTPRGQAQLIEDEGEVLHGYKDSLGYLTIGIGHLIDKRKGGSIPQRLSRIMFEDDIAMHTAEARANFDWFDMLDAVRQDVIVMLLFNMGLGGVQGFHNMLAAIQVHDYD